MTLNILLNSFEHSGYFLLIISSYPQFLKCIKNKSTKNISILWIIINCIGLLLLIINSIYKNNKIIYISSSLQLICLVFLGYLKLYYNNII